jgi:hypothetical protein
MAGVGGSLALIGGVVLLVLGDNTGGLLAVSGGATGLVGAFSVASSSLRYLG